MQHQEIKHENENRWFPSGHAELSGEQLQLENTPPPSPSVASGKSIAGKSLGEHRAARPTYFTSEIACWIGCLCISMYFFTCLYLGLGELLDRPPTQKAPLSPMKAVGTILSGANVLSTDAPANSSNKTSLRAFAAFDESRLVSNNSMPLPDRTAPAERDDPSSVVSPGSGQAFRDRTATGQECFECPEMVIAPSGSFTLGSKVGETWRDDWQKNIERPQVKIAIAKPIAVGRFAVSFDEWKACVADAACVAIQTDNGWGQGNRPVINVTWHEAKNYVEWLSRKTGKSYRMLSEAEREYVTRAGTTTPFWFGASPSPKIANYLWDRTLPVNSLTPNPWGLFHVHGNVGEWTADCWNSSHIGHPGNPTARLDGNCNRRVVKGGSWFNAASHIRSASRSGLDSNAYYRTVGLRVARVLDDTTQN